MEDAMSLIRDYLSRLDVASRGMPAARRDELAHEVQEHIDSALAEAGSQDETTVRNVLERLGRPEEIVAAESGWGAQPAGGAGAAVLAPGVARPRVGAVEIIALLLLSLGWVLLPIVGPLAGLVFVWISTAWSRGQKWIATAVVALLAVLPIVGLLAVGAGSFASSSQPVMTPGI